MYKTNAGEAHCVRLTRILHALLLEERLDSCEHDEQGEEYKRLNQSQTENHHGLDTTGSTGISRRALDSRQHGSSAHQHADQAEEGES
jgi:hypothetical protein